MVQKILEMKSEYEKIFHPKGAIRVVNKEDYIFYSLVEIIQILQSTNNSTTTEATNSFERSE